MADFDGRHSGRTRQEIVGERADERLAGQLVGDLLVERGADALNHAAPQLAFDHRRIDHRAAVLGDVEVGSSTNPVSGSTATTAL